MKFLIAAAMVAAVTRGSALAQPAGTTEPAAPTPLPAAPAPSEPPAPLLATPPLSKLLPAAPAPTESPLTTPALTKPLPAPRAPTVSEWYGWQVLLADGAVFGFAVAISQSEVALGWIGAGAMVHASHGKYGRSIASAGLRLVLPVLGVIAAAPGAGGCTGDACGFGEAVAGGLVGAGVAEVIDLLMATDEHEIAPPKMSKSWAPIASIRPSGATFGVAARF